MGFRDRSQNVTAQKARLAFRKFAVVVDKKASMI